MAAGDRVIDFLVRLLGTEKTRQGLKSVGTATKKMGDDVGRTEKKTRGLGKAFQGIMSVVGGVKTAVLGFFSGAAIIGAFTSFLGYVTRIRDGLAEIGKEATAALRTALPLAEQLGLSGPIGLVKAKLLALGVAERAGAAPEIAQTITQAALSQVKAPQAEQIKIAESVSATIAKTGGTAEEGVALVELLVSAGVRTQEQTLKAIALVQGHLLAAPELGLGTFARSALMGGTGLFSLGADLEDVLRLTAQGRAAGGGALRGAELMRQVSQIATGEEAQKVIAQQARISPEEATVMPAVEQIATLQQAIQGARQRGGAPDVVRLLQGIPGAQRTQLLRFFSETAIETGEAAAEAGGEFTPQMLQRQYREYLKTSPAQERQMEIRGQKRIVSAHPSLRRRGRVRDEAKEMLKEDRRNKLVSYWSDILQFEEEQIQAYEEEIHAVERGEKPSRFAPGQIQILTNKQRRALGPIGEIFQQRGEEVFRGEESREWMKGFEERQEMQKRKQAGEDVSRPQASIHIHGDFYAIPRDLTELPEQFQTGLGYG